MEEGSASNVSVDDRNKAFEELISAFTNLNVQCQTMGIKPADRAELTDCIAVCGSAEAKTAALKALRDSLCNLHSDRFRSKDAYELCKLIHNPDLSDDVRALIPLFITELLALSVRHQDIADLCRRATDNPAQQHPVEHFQTLRKHALACYGS